MLVERLSDIQEGQGRHEGDDHDEQRRFSTEERRACSQEEQHDDHSGRGHRFGADAEELLGLGSWVFAHRDPRGLSGLGVDGR